MSLRRAGFFRELEHGDGTPDAPSIHERLQPELRREKARIIAYLRAASVYAVSPGPTFDFFRLPVRMIIDSLALHTDGVWLWTSDFAFYVEHHDVAVPTSFVAHMRRNEWRPPTLTRGELIALAVHERRSGERPT